MFLSMAKEDAKEKSGDGQNAQEDEVVVAGGMLFPHESAP
mgnify:CR=1 FL=1